MQLAIHFDAALHAGATNTVLPVVLLLLPLIALPAA
jgi:hypothetical protein